MTCELRSARRSFSTKLAWGRGTRQEAHTPHQTKRKAKWLSDDLKKYQADLDEARANQTFQRGLMVCAGLGWFALVGTCAGMTTADTSEGVAWLIIFSVILFFINIWATPLAYRKLSESCEVFEQKKKILEAGQAKLKKAQLLKQQHDRAEERRLQTNKERQAMQEVDKARIQKCQLILARYLSRLKEIEYDIEFLSKLIHGEHVSPEEFEETVQAILGDKPKSEADILKEQYSVADETAVADFEAKQRHRDQLLASYKKRKAEIKQKQDNGELDNEEAEIFLQSAKRDFEQKMRAVDNA